MTKAEKIKHFEDYKACFRAVCADFNKGDYTKAACTYGIIKRMYLLKEYGTEALEEKILQDYKIDRSDFVERVILMNI